jgi:hypothetical protein
MSDRQPKLYTCACGSREWSKFLNWERCRACAKKRKKETMEHWRANHPGWWQRSARRYQSMPAVEHDIDRSDGWDWKTAPRDSRLAELDRILGHGAWSGPVAQIVESDHAHHSPILEMAEVA